MALMMAGARTAPRSMNAQIMFYVEYFTEFKLEEGESSYFAPKGTWRAMGRWKEQQGLYFLDLPQMMYNQKNPYVAHALCGYDEGNMGVAHIPVIAPARGIPEDCDERIQTLIRHYEMSGHVSRMVYKSWNTLEELLAYDWSQLQHSADLFQLQVINNLADLGYPWGHIRIVYFFFNGV
jgi:hypothetical protein